MTLSERGSIAIFLNKNMIRKTSLLRHESPCLPLKIFKLLNKSEQRSNNVGKTVAVFPHISGETLGTLVCSVGITKS